jgi:hypothetical protein
VSFPHKLVVFNQGYCGGCEVCGSKEEYYSCEKCGRSFGLYDDADTCEEPDDEDDYITETDVDHGDQDD